MSKLIFKEDEYSYKELWRLYASGKHLFSEGMVIDKENKQKFDISEFPLNKAIYITGILKDMNDVEEDASSISKKKKLEMNKIRLCELELAYKKGTLTTDELRELISLKYSSKELKDSYSFSSYLFLNTSAPLPDLSNDELGKFYKLCHFYLTHKSNILLIKKDIRSNPVSNDDLLDLFKIKERALYSFFKKLKEHRIIKYLVLDEKKHMIINPIYVLNGKLTPINYILFKEDVDKYLPNIPCELRDLWYMEFLELGLEVL